MFSSSTRTVQVFISLWSCYWCIVFSYRCIVSVQPFPAKTMRRTVVKMTEAVERNSLILCGPSGVGKGTVIKSLLSLWGDDKLSLSVSHTTRQPRTGEVDGVHYNFVTKPYMEEALKQSDVFLEYAQVHGNLYGTSRAAVQNVHQHGKTCILDVDVDGVRQIKAQHFPGKYVFLTPPSIDVLAKRLHGRSTETDAEIALRMQTAEEIIAYGTAANNFDLVVVNEDLDKTLVILNRHLVDWFPHTFPKLLIK